MKVLLEGVMTNRDAIGARMKVEANDGREIWRAPSAGKGFCSTDSPIQHFGLGTATKADLLEIYWPSGLIQTYVDMQTKDQHDLRETGIHLNGTPSVGGQVTIGVVGARNAQVDIFYSPTQVYIPDPVSHGVKRLAGNPTLQGSLTLTDKGLGRFTFDIPNDPNLGGTSLFVQAVVTDVNNSGSIVVKTNAVELAIP
jgi:hypothetical protein